MFANSETIIRLMPEVILVALATWIFIGGTFWASRTFWSTLAMLTYLVAAIALYRHGNAPLVMSPITIDSLGYTLRWLALISGAILTLMVSYQLRDKTASETLGLLMLAVTGVMLVSCAGDLVLLFLGLELVSIPTYVLLYLGRPGRESAEATAKYFYLSILSSALLLYGFSFLYGMAGTTTLVGEGTVLGIQQKLSAAVAGYSGSGITALAPLALVLVFAGLGFKIAAVPFHFYAPDVYQGTTNANAGLLAVMPKIAGMVALVRITVIAMPALAGYAWHLSLVIAVLTMTIGNVCALWQTNLRRMLGYSSIAHAGYMLIGLTVALGTNSLGGDVNPGYGGVGALVFYLVVYAFATLGTFAALGHLSSPEQDVSTLDDIAGLNKTHPTSAGLLAVFMFSLAGIPPLAGFWGKLALFKSAVGVVTYSTDATITPWFVVLAIAGALNAAIAAAYYLRVVSSMYFRPATSATPQPASAGGLGAAVICASMVIVVGVSPGRLMTAAREADASAHQLPAVPVQTVADQPVAPLEIVVQR